VLVEPELLAMKNVVLTPHLGSAVTELREMMAGMVVDNIVAVLEGRQPPNCWNAEIYRKPETGNWRPEPRDSKLETGDANFIIPVPGLQPQLNTYAGPSPQKQI